MKHIDAHSEVNYLVFPSPALLDVFYSSAVTSVHANDPVW